MQMIGDFGGGGGGASAGGGGVEEWKDGEKSFLIIYNFSQTFQKKNEK